LRVADEEPEHAGAIVRVQRGGESGVFSTVGNGHWTPHPVRLPRWRR
jgi:hypothetical protein